MKAYRYFKVEVYQVGLQIPTSDVSNRMLLNKLRLFDTLDGTTTQSFINGIAPNRISNMLSSNSTAITNESATSAWDATLRNENNVDINITKKTPLIFSFDAVNQYVLRTVELACNSNFTTACPHHFAIFGSNDNINWEQILSYKNFFKGTAAYTTRRSFTNEVSGKVTAAAGDVNVCLLQLSDGTLTHVATVTPGADGSWRQITENTTPYVVLYLPTADGIRPMADGIINPVPYVI